MPRKYSQSLANIGCVASDDKMYPVVRMYNGRHTSLFQPPPHFPPTCFLAEGLGHALVTVLPPWSERSSGRTLPSSPVASRRSPLLRLTCTIPYHAEKRYRNNNDRSEIQQKRLTSRLNHAREGRGWNESLAPFSLRLFSIARWLDQDRTNMHQLS